MPQTPSARAAPFCAIDFGTSNSAVAVPQGGGAGGMRLVALEGDATTMPTAVFYRAEGPDLHTLPVSHGRAAMAAYLEGIDGRLMRSMKSVLGSALMAQSTDIGAGRSVSFAEIIAGYLRHLKERAEADAGQSLPRVVLGRPVYFVDDDPGRDAQAQAALEAAAHAVGFGEVHFQYEPIAAALHYEATIDQEQHVLVADIGGGTSDFSVVRVGPQRRGRVDRRDDVLANHGVHIAGTDFDRRLSLATVMPVLGHGTHGPSIDGRPGRQVPSALYFDLATWHLVNTVYRPQRVQEARAMRVNFDDPRFHPRLMAVITERLGHDLLAQVEEAKVAAAGGAAAGHIDLGLVESGLAAAVQVDGLAGALRGDVDRIAAAARETVALAGLSPNDIDALYLTGGSTGLGLLADALAAVLPAARRVQGERLASVATGLGLHAEQLFGRT